MAPLNGWARSPTMVSLVVKERSSTRDYYDRHCIVLLQIWQACMNSALGITRVLHSVEFNVVCCYHEPGVPFTCV
jgi:hypothetical protein